jgi:hypothetical protein
MNMKHFEIRTFFFFFLFFAFFKEALEAGMHLHILIQSTFIVSFLSHEAMDFKKKKNSDFKKSSETGPEL